MRRPLLRSSASNISLPRAIFSSRRSFLNHCFIFVRAEPLFAMFSQSRLGPGAFFAVRTSTISPFCSTWSKVTIRPLTDAPTMLLPTAEWIEYAKSMGVAPAGRFMTSPLGENTNTSSANMSILRLWKKSVASDSCWLSNSLRTQANFSSSPVFTPLSPILYFQCAAMPYSAVRCISQVLICTSNGIPCEPMTVVCTLWYIFGFGVEI